MRYLIYILILLSSCNPVKQVLKDKDKFDQVADEVIRRGYCVNDTVVVTEVKDSVIYKDSITVVTEKVPCKDFDTTIGRARIRVSSGVLYYSYKDSVVYRTRTVKETVRDRSLEDVLNRDILKLRDSLKQALFDKKECASDLKATKREARNHRVKMWLIIIAIGTFAFRKQILSVWRFFG
jgi:hypothetical protein